MKCLRRAVGDRFRAGSSKASGGRLMAKSGYFIGPLCRCRIDMESALTTRIAPAQDRKSLVNFVPSKAALKSFRSALRNTLMTNESQKTVLIVEDDAAVAAYIADVAQAFFGVKALRAATLQAARELFKKRGEEILTMVVDFSLGDGTGAALVKEFATERPDIGVIFVTGHLVDEAKLAKVVGREVSLVLKPFGPFELKEALEKSLWVSANSSAYA
jgi:CheY-like chemotaxis protein